MAGREGAGVGKVGVEFIVSGSPATADSIH